MHRRTLGCRHAAHDRTLLLFVGLSVALLLCTCGLGINAARAQAAKGPADNVVEKDAGGRPAANKGASERETAEKAAAQSPGRGKAGPTKGRGRDQEATSKAAKGGGDKANAEKKPSRERAVERSPEDRGSGEDSIAQKDKESVLVWLYRSMTPRYVVIFLGVTFNEIALVVMIILGLRRKCLCPLGLARDFEAKLDKKQYQEAYDLAKEDNSFLGKVLAAGMANLSEGHDAALEAMHEVGEEQNMRLEQRNGHIALIAQIGPMLGLLATVDGIVRAFAVIAGKDVTPKPSQLAEGIGIALVNTVVGLWLAIPSIIFYHLIRNRLTRLVLEVGMLSTRMMKRFSNVSVAVKKG
jgi:biopolymer transport protein ExbB